MFSFAHADRVYACIRVNPIMYNIYIYHVYIHIICFGLMRAGMEHRHRASGPRAGAGLEGNTVGSTVPGSRLGPDVPRLIFYVFLCSLGMEHRYRTPGPRAGPGLEGRHAALHAALARRSGTGLSRASLAASAAPHDSLCRRRRRRRVPAVRPARVCRAAAAPVTVLVFTSALLLFDFL